MPAVLPTAYNVSFYVYILTNKTRTALYIGVTNNLEKRVQQHRDKENTNSFTARYNLSRLMYYERFSDIRDAIAREKELKGWRREKKDQLIVKVSFFPYEEQ